MFESIDPETQNNKKALTFKINNVDLSIINSIRRTILSDIENIAFYFDNNNKNPEKASIKIEQNDSPLHNEFIAQRISMIPLHLDASLISDWDDNYLFEIDVQNNSNKSMTVYSKDIKIKSNDEYISENDRDQIFPPYVIDKTSYFIPITKLPPGGELKVKMNAIKDSASRNACFGVVSLCTFENAIDEKKKESELIEFIKKNIGEDEEITEEKKSELKKQFNTLDIQRAFKTNKFNEPSEFIFKLESTCLLNNYEIFSKGIQKLIDNLSNIYESYSDLVSIEKNDEVYNITILEQTHTIGNLLQCIIYNNYIRIENELKVEFIGYFVPHPLDKRVVMKLKYANDNDNDQVDKDFKDMISNAIKELELVKKNWENWSESQSV